MAKLDFYKLPVTTLFGSRWSNFKNITKGIQVDEAYKTKFRLTKTLSALLSLTHPIENHLYNKKVANIKIEDDPVFILGHWRSGTTYVHNVLSKDPNFGYNTTYQTIFSNAMLWGQSFFKSIMESVMPDKRPTDNMELNTDQPQEEEFAFSNIMPVSFYNFWFFPNKTMEYCDKYLLFNNISKEEYNQFHKEFDRLIKTALYNTGGKRFLSKNPPHTGRVKDLVKMYPKAKFIYLIRNPYTVFESTKSFFTKTIKPLKFQDISEDQIEKNIIEVYKKLYHTYENDKKLIPKGNLVELKFEDFETDAYAMTEAIYEMLNLEGFSEAAPKFKAYINEKKGHKKNNYEYNFETINKVNEHWEFALKDWKYEILVNQKSA